MPPTNLLLSGRKTMKTYRFTARIQEGDSGGAGVVIPFDVEKEFGVKGRVAVEATFDGIPYRGSLMKCGPGQYILGILKAIWARDREIPSTLFSGKTMRKEPWRFPPNLKRY